MSRPEGPPGEDDEAGRRPLPGPPTRIARALLQEAGGASMHIPGHPHVASEGGHERGPAAPGGGVIRAAGPHNILLPDRTGTKNGRGRDKKPKPWPMWRNFRGPC